MLTVRHDRNERELNPIEVWSAMDKAGAGHGPGITIGILVVSGMEIRTQGSIMKKLIIIIFVVGRDSAGQDVVVGVMKMIREAIDPCLRGFGQDSMQFPLLFGRFRILQLFLLEFFIITGLGRRRVRFPAAPAHLFFSLCS